MQISTLDALDVTMVCSRWQDTAVHLGLLMSTSKNQMPDQKSWIYTVQALCSILGEHDKEDVILCLITICISLSAGTLHGYWSHSVSNHPIFITSQNLKYYLNRTSSFEDIGSWNLAFWPKRWAWPPICRPCYLGNQLILMQLVSLES